MKCSRRCLLNENTQALQDHYESAEHLACVAQSADQDDDSEEHDCREPMRDEANDGELKAQQNSDNHTEEERQHY